MNIFKWITGRAGKVALSAMQAVGLSAVVGVAGIAAWQYLDSPAENNSFTPGAYNPGEVVYVSGANTGSYASGSYAGGGEAQSSVQISANTFKRLERQEMAEQAARDMDEYSPEVSSSAIGPAYQMGGTDGLGTGANAANEIELKNNPLAAMQQSMAGVSDMVAQAQQQAQQQAQAGKEGAPVGAASSPALASASKNWSAGATGGASGNAFNSSFAVQDSGKNTRNGGGPSASANPGDILASAQRAMNNATEGARMRAQATFGSENIGANRDASVQGFRSSKEGRDLKYITKRSNDAAKNRNRAANEGSRAFLASTKISGGMMISAENVTTGQGQGSKDFTTDTDSQLRDIKTWQTDTAEVDAAQRKKDRDDLRKWIWIAVPLALALTPFIARAAFLGTVTPWPWNLVWWIIAGILAGIAIAPCITLLAKGVEYAKNYGGSSLSTWASVLGGTLTAMIGVSLIPAVGKLLAGLTNWIVALGGLGAGLGAAWLTTGLTKDAALDTEQLLNTEVDAEQGGTTGGNK